MQRVRTRWLRGRSTTRSWPSLNRASSRRSTKRLRSRGASNTLQSRRLLRINTWRGSMRIAAGLHRKAMSTNLKSHFLDQRDQLLLWPHDLLDWQDLERDKRKEVRVASMKVIIQIALVDFKVNQVGYRGLVAQSVRERLITKLHQVFLDLV